MINSVYDTLTPEGAEEAKLIREKELKAFESVLNAKIAARGLAFERLSKKFGFTEGDFADLREVIESDDFISKVTKPNGNNGNNGNNSAKNFK